MPLKIREFETLVNKLELKTREGKDRLAWFEHDGQVIARTRRSRSTKGGDLPRSDAIRQQLKLNEEQLSGILGCSIQREGYVEILRKKGLIPT